MDSTDIQLSSAQIELKDLQALEGSAFFNKDLAPIPISRRTWSTYAFAALWVGMACNIPTYMMSSALIAAGMNWWQALLTIFLGNAIVLVPIVLNSHPGTKYGIPFPVLARASYGVVGSNLPALMRALVACGWFGINAWIGGQALYTFIKAIYPAWGAAGGAMFEGYSTAEWLSFFLFWLLNVAVVWRGVESVKTLASWAAPFVFTMTAALAGWSVSQAHGFGRIMSDAGKFTSLDSFLPVFIPSVTAMVGSWATLSLNVPDFTRFARGQKEQIIGQAAALPTSMTAFAAMGVIITSAGMLLFPSMGLTELWDPVKLIGGFSNQWLVAVAMFVVMLATLGVNVTANMVSPANDLANCFPKWISFRTGALLTALFGLLLQPWRLMADPRAYIFQWLLGYSGGLGSIAAIMIVDYWIIRKKNLRLVDLYTTHGVYQYTSGWNWRAVIATMVGCTFAWIGLVVPPLRILYAYAWFVGFAAAGGSYYLLMQSSSKSPADGTGD